MEWYKQGSKYTADTRFTLSEVGAISRLLANVAFHERPLTDLEMTSIVGAKVLRQVCKALKYHYSTTISEVLQKGYEDVLVVQHKRIVSRKSSESYRKRQVIISKGSDVSCDNHRDNHRDADVTSIEVEVEGEVENKQGKPDLPFNTADFKTAWDEWNQHRREKKKPLTPLAVKKQFSQFIEIGEKRAIAAINHSILKGWTGIFEQSKGFDNKPDKEHTDPITGRPLPNGKTRTDLGMK